MATTEDRPELRNATEEWRRELYDGAPEGLARDQGVVDAYLGVAELA